MTSKRTFIIAEPTDYVAYPGGGQIQQAKNIMSVYKDKVALVGFVTDDDSPIGRWGKRKINDINYDFFAVAKIKKQHSKTIIPQRIRSLWYFWKYRKKIAAYKSTKNIFIQAPEVYFALHAQSWNSVCYRFPGTNNPLTNSPRYKWGKYLKFIFEKPFFRALKKADCVLASADDYQIELLGKRSEGILSREKIIKFPTRYDDIIYRPLDMLACRAALNLSKDKVIFVQSGRLSAVKCCDFVLNSFIEYYKTNSNSMLIFLGDGEERAYLEGEVEKNKLTKAVLFPGHLTKETLIHYLCAANAVLFGTLCKRWEEAGDEGWSVAMVESLACGKPIVTTPVSGAYDMVKDGENGFILRKRDVMEMASKMEKAVHLEHPNQTSLNISKPWSMSGMQQDFEHAWTRIKTI